MFQYPIVSPRTSTAITTYHIPLYTTHISRPIQSHFRRNSGTNVKLKFGVLSDVMGAPGRQNVPKVVFSSPTTEEASMEEVSIIGLDLAKNVFQMHGAQPNGTVGFTHPINLVFLTGKEVEAIKAICG